MRARSPKSRPRLRLPLPCIFPKLVPAALEIRQTLAAQVRFAKQPIDAPPLGPQRRRDEPPMLAANLDGFRKFAPRRGSPAERHNASDAIGRWHQHHTIGARRRSSHQRCHNKCHAASRSVVGDES
jgi:hypothetical protein